MITPAFAQAATGGGATDLLTSPLIPMILVFVVLYFLMLRPQQKRLKEHQGMLKNLRREDTVVTTGGLIGRVTKVTDDASEVEIEIAPNVRVKVVRTMISEVRVKGAPVKAA